MPHSEKDSVSSGDTVLPIYHTGRYRTITVSSDWDIPLQLSKACTTVLYFPGFRLSDTALGSRF